MIRIILVAVAFLAAAVLAPWPWLTMLLALGAPAVLGLWLVAMLTDDHLVIRHAAPMSRSPDQSSPSAPDR